MLQPTTGEGFVFGQECERADKEKLESLSILPAAPVCAWQWCDTCTIHPATLGVYISVLMACAGVTWLTTVMSVCVPRHGSMETHRAPPVPPVLHSPCTCHPAPVIPPAIMHPPLSPAVHPPSRPCPPHATCRAPAVPPPCIGPVCPDHPTWVDS